MFVLYAEDDIDDFFLFCETLSSIDPAVQVVNTRDGFETIKLLENVPVLPDIVFLDINMPSMDGKACLKAIRKNERFNSLPVVIYTTCKDPLDKEHCIELGATDYIQKPNSLTNEIQLLERYVKSKI